MSRLPPEDHLSNAIVDLQEAIKGFELQQRGYSLEIRQCKRALGHLKKLPYG